jgi:methylmalonyl-CoA/ethylmalonyl-CoA epimerase
MLSSFVFHHIGYVTDSIEKTSALYQAAGYHVSETTIDPVQQTKICFLSKEGNPDIELIEPLDENSSVNKVLKRNGGAAPYHICYETDDVNRDFDALLAIGYTPLFRPVEATALNDKLICYFYKKETGFIEIVNKN